MAKKMKGAIHTEPPAGTKRPAKRRAPNNIRQFREDRKWTQWQLAKISRLSERTIQRVEAGGQLGVTAEMALAGAFGMDIADLYSCDPHETVDFMFLRRVVSGNSLLDLLENAQAGSYEVDDLRDDEIKPVREFIESLNVWALMWKDKEPDERVAARHIFTSVLDELDSRSLRVFVGPSHAAAAADHMPVRPLKVAIIRSSNPRIIQPRSLRQLGKEMCAVIADASPRDLDPRLVRAITNN